jgi:hypothetical protein
VGNYALLADVRDEGAPASITDARINARIAKWETIVEKITRNVFRVVDVGELLFDGNNFHILHFNLPIVDVEYVKLNNSDTALDTSYYRVFNAKNDVTQDRYNPRIELIRSETSIFSATRSIFAQGYTQRIKARWGYVESDGLGGFQTPTIIKDIVIQLVMRDLQSYYASAMGGGSSGFVSPIRREKTYGHEIEYQATAEVRTTWGNIPKDIYDQLMLFRAPIAVEVPDTRYFHEVDGGVFILGW